MGILFLHGIAAHLEDHSHFQAAGLLCVLFCAVSQVWPQEGTQEKIGKIKFIALMEGAEGGETLGHDFYWRFCGKGEAGQDKQFRIGQFESFWWTLSYRLGP